MFVSLPFTITAPPQFPVKKYFNNPGLALKSLDNI